MVNDLNCNWVDEMDGCSGVPVFEVRRVWDDHVYAYCSYHWALAFGYNPEFPAVGYTKKDAARDQYNADAPWRDVHPGPKMDVMKTRDGKDRIEWCHASNDGNLDACWVIYQPGDEYPAILDSDPYPWKDYS